MSAILSVRSLEVSYGTIPALKGIDLEVQKGEIVTLIGANGAGKTTTLRTISGLLKPKAGHVTYNGADITGVKPHVITAKGISHVPEGRGIFANLSVADNLELGAYLRKDKISQAELERVFTLFPVLKERMKQNAGTLSGGEQQMLAIGRALMAKPKLLMLDEPSTGLAPQVVERIFSIVAEFGRSGTAVLLVEQNAYLTLQHASRAYVLEGGTMALSGTAEELRDNARVRDIYLGGTA